MLVGSAVCGRSVAGLLQCYSFTTLFVRVLVSSWSAGVWTMSFGRSDIEARADSPEAQAGARDFGSANLPGALAVSGADVGVQGDCVSAFRKIALRRRVRLDRCGERRRRCFIRNCGDVVTFSLW
jgi:hypothetical protein